MDSHSGLRLRDTVTVCGTVTLWTHTVAEDYVAQSRYGLLVSGFKRPAVNRTSPQADTDSHGRYKLH